MQNAVDFILFTCFSSHAIFLCRSNIFVTFLQSVRVSYRSDPSHPSERQTPPYPTGRTESRPFLCQKPTISSPYSFRIKSTNCFITTSPSFVSEKTLTGIRKNLFWPLGSSSSAGSNPNWSSTTSFRPGQYWLTPTISPCEDTNR